MSTFAVAPPPPSGSPWPGARERCDSPWLNGTERLPDGAGAAARQAGRDLELDASMPFPIAPATAWGAFADWWVHVWSSPAKQLDMARSAARLGVDLLAVAMGQALTEPLPQDKRFDDEAWRQEPFRCLVQAFLLHQSWWQRATRDVPGMSRHHADMVSFAARQWLDMMAPANFIVSNPVVLRRTARTGGRNLLAGAVNAAEDMRRELADLPPVGAEAFKPGETVAVTPGRVVFRNRLIELIQYAPATRSVHAEPILLVPAWIMKYYVLDLSPHNSMVRHLVAKGFTVFVVSWKNPDAAEQDLGMDDYANLGVLAALDEVARIVPGAKVHACGYCLGGTLLSIVAASLGRAARDALKSVTLLAAQTDFTEPGELGLFIDESQVDMLARRMRRTGYLDKTDMRAAFQLLRSNDLVWSYRMRSQLLGERQPITDLMAWNADGTRLPRRMHVEYLRELFLRNALARGEFALNGKVVNLSDIRVPVFSVGTVQDHVAPWRSVFKLHALTDAEQTFVLTAGGHNVGIVNPPGQNERSSFRLRTQHPGDRLLTADQWLAAAPQQPGSWWTAWFDWLANHSGPRTRARTLERPEGHASLGDAPGTYVQER